MAKSSNIEQTDYEIREMTLEEFWPLVQDHSRNIFDENTLIVRPHLYFSEAECANLDLLRKSFAETFRVYLAVFKGDDLVGWSWGFQDTGESFYMVSSAILPEHRKRGLYGKLLQRMLSIATEKGFQRIYSRHCQTNNAILIAKLKAGFQITSFELNDAFGALVHLTYFTNPTRRKVLAFRAGEIRADEELRNLFRL